MATVRPFIGFRPQRQFAAQVAAKPYDVLSTEEARAEAATNPLSFLHVSKPEIDLPVGVNPYDEQVYQKGRENLQRLIADGILQKDQTPCYYLYAQVLGAHGQYGIVGCGSVEEYLNNTIRKHELTRNDKERDRMNHVLATNAHTGPIFVMYRANPSLKSIADHVRTGQPVYDFTVDDGIRHIFWVVSDRDAMREITDAFRMVERLYVADGHHRLAAAARVGQTLAHSNMRHTGDEEYNFFLAVLFPHDQLRIMDYNRVVKDLHGNPLEAFLSELRRKFTVRDSLDRVHPTKKSEYGMYLGGRWYRLEASERLQATSDPVERLDVSILQNHVLGPMLGIVDPRSDRRIDFVGGIRGLGELEQRVDSGEMAVAFSLYPTSVDELLAIADAGKIMPPKSTWFEPKLRDGLVVHLLS